MATFYVNASTGNNSRNGTAPLDMNSLGGAFAGVGPVATIQYALTLISSGDTISIAGGTYTAPTGGIQVTQSCHLIGENKKTVLVNPFYPAGHAVASEPVFVLALGATNITGITFRGMTIHNVLSPSNALAGAYGIWCDLTPTTGTCGASGSKLSRLLIEDVDVINMGAQGIALLGSSTGDNFYVFTTLNRVQCITNWSDGFYTGTSASLSLRDSYFIANGRNGALLGDGTATGYTVCPTIIGCGFENNTRNVVSATPYAAGLHIVLSQGVFVAGCDFEQYNNTWASTATFQPADGDAISGTGVPASAFVKNGSRAAHTLDMATGSGAGASNPANNASGVPSFTSLLSSVTIGAHTYSNVQLVGDSATLVFGNYVMHALNLRTCPGATVLACNFQNGRVCTDTDQFGIWASDNSGTPDTVSNPDSVKYVLGGLRGTDAGTVVKLVDHAKDAFILLPHVDSNTTPTAMNTALNHPVSWT